MADEENKVAADNSAASASKSVKKKTVKKASKKAVKKKTVKKASKKVVKKKSVKSATTTNGNGQKEKAKIRLKNQPTPQVATTSKVKVPPKVEKDRLSLLSTLSIFMLLIIGIWAIYSYMNEEESATVEEIVTEAVLAPAIAPVATPAPEVQVIEEAVIAPVVEVAAPDTVKEAADEAVEVTDAVDQKDESKGFFESVFGRKDAPSSADESNEAAVAGAAAGATQPSADPMAMQNDPFGPPPGFYDDMPPQGFGPPEGFGPPAGFYDDMPPQGFIPPPGFYDMPPMPEYEQGRGW